MSVGEGSEVGTAGVEVAVGWIVLDGVGCGGWVAVGDSGSAGVFWLDGGEVVQAERRAPVRSKARTSRRLIFICSPGDES